MTITEEKAKDFKIDFEDVSGILAEAKALNNSISEFIEDVKNSNNSQNDFMRSKADDMTYFSSMIDDKINAISIIVQDYLHASN